ncbi:MAG: diacylglycerol kinase family protein [Patescibacteria group bacterium]
MYCYLYDDFIQGNKRFEKELALVENRLTDLGIAGKISRLALFRNAEEMIRDEIDKGVTTVVVLGNDDTVRKVLNVLAESRVVFGIIPIGPKNELARLMGVPEGVAACDILSSRRVETIDIGLVNGRKFIMGISVPQFRAELTCEDKFRIIPTSFAELLINNLATVCNPCDGFLQAIIRADVKRGFFKRSTIEESTLPLQTMSIRAEKPIKIFVDGEEMEGTRFDISVEMKCLKIITGKDRVFQT